ncbi:hypothetical protein E2C01_026795 [Portunus trituberculatus]|uniref:Uncharacterized protein n=1 Tax=Portunus trituberculatus TaxID=210409 RepID=A0A5B7EJ52_PORTR|nr:hypothetical protein [Portunus trituberculatus]
MQNGPYADQPARHNTSHPVPLLSTHTRNQTETIGNKHPCKKIIIIKQTRKNKTIDTSAASKYILTAAIHHKTSIHIKNSSALHLLQATQREGSARNEVLAPACPCRHSCASCLPLTRAHTPKVVVSLPSHAEKAATAPGCLQNIQRSRSELEPHLCSGIV